MASERTIEALKKRLEELERAEKALEQGLREVSLLNALGDRVSGSLSFEEIAQGALDGVFSLMEPDMALLFIRDGEKLFVQGKKCGEGRFAQRVTEAHRVGECLCGLAVSEGCAVYSRDIQADPRCTWNECKQAGLVSFAALPLRAGDEIIGVLGLASAEERDFEFQFTLLDTAAKQVAIGLQNALYYSRMSDHAAELETQIAKREQAGAALEETELRYRALFDGAGDAIFVMKSDRFVDCNRSSLEMFRCTREELLDRTPDAFSPPVQPDGKDSRTEALRRIHGAIEGNPQSFEWVHRRADGKDFHAEVSLNAVRLATGTYVQAIVRDITLRKDAERLLAESEEKYRIVVENASDAIYIAQDERLTFPNPRATEIFGYTREELMSISFMNLIHPDDRALVGERYRQRLAGEAPPSPYEFRMVTKRGDSVPVSLSSVRITWEGRPATLNFLRDMTQQKAWDRRMRHIQRMEAIGTLAGGIAHNINNTLMGIQGRASLMMMDKDPYHPDYDHLRGIEEYVRNAAELTRDLLGFAKGGKYEVKPVDVNELLAKENRMFTRTKREITIRERFDPGLRPVEADKGQMQQMLMNLYVNAWQAMPAGGEIFVRTENVVVDEEDVPSMEIEAGRYVKISITDTGMGMDAATREKIFDPFFTTRDVGGGTGLGLASVYGIVKNHGGFIHVFSEPGEGATFTIHLPASIRMEVVDEKPVAASLQKGEGTILLVDDQPMILDVGGQLLRQIGYEVLTARGGREAVVLYEQNRNRIRLVVLDMIMPEMSGGETFEQLKAMDPDVKVLLSSGYSINGQAQEILDRGCSGFIQKPFRLEELSEKLEEILRRFP